MPVREICCLANSRKHGARCIAGIDLASGKWVRPVSGIGDGKLLHFDYQLPPDNNAPRVLDIIRFPVKKPHPARHQPENVLLAPGSWELVHRPQERKEFRERFFTLHKYLADDNPLFFTEGDRVPYAQFNTTPSTCSLMLIRPEWIKWTVAGTQKGTRQIRAAFRHREQYYHFVITDPLWEARLEQAPLRDYPRDSFGITPKHEIWFTLSLGEPMAENGCCFKLIATVIVWPPLP